MSLLQVALVASTSLASSSGPAQGGTGTPQSYSVNGFTYTLTPTTNGIGNPGTAYPNDTITWTVTTSPADAGRLLYIWVDNAVVPASDFVENVDNGTITLDGSGSGTFSLTVVASPSVHNLFRMYVGYGLYQGFLTHGEIGI